MSEFLALSASFHHNLKFSFRDLYLKLESHRPKLGGGVAAIGK